MSDRAYERLLLLARGRARIQDLVAELLAAKLLDPMAFAMLAREAKRAVAETAGEET